jgi:nucleoredoxin
MVSYMKESHGDWWAVAHGSEQGKALKSSFGVTGIPALIVLKRDGTLVTKDGRAGVQGTGPGVVQKWKSA